MGTFGQGLVEISQDRVDAAVSANAKMATVIGRDAAGPGAQVIFYGSAGGQSDVKCPESVIVAEGDLVALVKVEHDWLIVANYTGRSLADEAIDTSWSSLTQVTPTTFVDMPNSPTIDWIKMRDSTIMRFSLQTSAFGSNTANQVKHALHITSSDGATDYVEEISHMVMNTTGDHYHFTGSVKAASAHPAGGYSAVVQWRRSSGTGFIQVDANDRLFVQVREAWS